MTEQELLDAIDEMARDPKNAGLADFLAWLLSGKPMDFPNKPPREKMH